MALGRKLEIFPIPFTGRHRVSGMQVNVLEIVTSGLGEQFNLVFAGAGHIPEERRLSRASVTCLGRV